jgi:hypothetical protein
MFYEKIVILFTVIGIITSPLGAIPAGDFDVYNAVGTGEPRPENWEPTRQYSRFRLTCEDIGDTTMKDFTLNGTLKNKALEDEINAWVINTLETTNLHGVLYTAVNGYMDVTVGMWVGDRYYLQGDAQNAVWNLKTGERITKFSDLFYEGENFIPAVSEAMRNYWNYYGAGTKNDIYYIENEPKNFSALTLLYLDPCFDFNAYGDSARSAPMYNQAAAHNYMPVWFYYDMTELFNEGLGEQFGWSSATLNTNTAAEFTEEDFLENGDLIEAKIFSPRFLSKEEVAARNADLEEIYNVIENSAEYKNYEMPFNRSEEDPFFFYEQEDFNHSDFPYDLGYRENQSYYVRHFFYMTADQYEPIKTLVSFPENGTKSVVDTPFGAFYKNRETGEIITPSDDVMLTVSEDFSALLDIDLNGKPEIISLDNGVKIFTEDNKPIAAIPLKYAPQNYTRITFWTVTKDKKTGEVSGEIYYLSDDHWINKEAIITYEIENGKIIITDETDFSFEDTHDNIAKNFEPRADTETVIYSGRWLIQNDIALSGGSAKKHFDALSKQLEMLRSEPRSSILVYADLCRFDTNIVGFLKNTDGGKMYKNAGEITPEGFDYDILQFVNPVINYDDIPYSLIFAGKKLKTVPTFIMKSNESGCDFLPVSGKVYYDFRKPLFDTWDIPLKVKSRDKLTHTPIYETYRFIATESDFIQYGG